MLISKQEESRAVEDEDPVIHCIAGTIAGAYFITPRDSLASLLLYEC